MKTQAIQNTTISGVESQSFGIKFNGYVADLLSNNIYSDKELAVVREICTNAWDANQDVPFEVNIPSQIDPTLVIRDYGDGLDEESIYELYTTYFSSGSLGDEKKIGGFGLGSKSPIALVDSFTVTSINAGIKKEYLIFKKDGMPSVSKVSEIETLEKSGLEVKVEIPQNSLNKVREYIPKVCINLSADNGELPTLIGYEPLYYTKEYVPKFKDNFTSFIAESQVHTGLSFMLNNVQYPVQKIDRSKVKEVLYKISGKTEEEVDRCLISYSISDTTSFNAIIKLDGSAVMPAVSREALSETDETKDLINRKIAEVYFKLVKASIEEVEKLDAYSYASKIKMLLTKYRVKSFGSSKVYLNLPCENTLEKGYYGNIFELKENSHTENLHVLIFDPETTIINHRMTTRYSRRYKSKVFFNGAKDCDIVYVTMGDGTESKITYNLNSALDSEAVQEYLDLSTEKKTIFVTLGVGVNTDLSTVKGLSDKTGKWHTSKDDLFTNRERLVSLAELRKVVREEAAEYRKLHKIVKVKSDTPTIRKPKNPSILNASGGAVPTDKELIDNIAKTRKGSKQKRQYVISTAISTTQTVDKLINPNSATPDLEFDIVAKESLIKHLGNIEHIVITNNKAKKLFGNNYNTVLGTVKTDIVRSLVYKVYKDVTKHFKVYDFFKGSEDLLEEIGSLSSSQIVVYGKRTTVVSLQDLDNAVTKYLVTLLLSQSYIKGSVGFITDLCLTKREQVLVKGIVSCTRNLRYIANVSPLLSSIIADTSTSASTNSKAYGLSRNLLKLGGKLCKTSHRKIARYLVNISADRYSYGDSISISSDVKVYKEVLNKLIELKG